MHSKKLYFNIFIFLILLASCFNNDNYENPYSFSKNSNKIFLNLKMQKSNIDNIDNYIEWTKQTEKLFLDNNKNIELIQFFGESIVGEENIFYKSYLSFVISEYYWQKGSKEAALYYMLCVDRDAYSIQYDFKPIGYYIAKRVISCNTPYEIKEKMYDVLLTEYKDIIDVPYVLLELSDLYKENFDMNKAVIVMKKIISIYTSDSYEGESSINISKINNEINFYYSKKDWIYQDLGVLIDNIKDAIMKKDKKLLYKYVSKSSFQVRVFQKLHQQSWSFYDIKIHKRWNNRIVFADQLEEFSSTTEAYLRSKNWNFPLLRTWYFYFKKVDYPYETDIHGGWEWAGIYFGNPF